LVSHNENKLKQLFGKENNVELIRMDLKDKTSVRGALKVQNFSILRMYSKFEFSERRTRVDHSTSS
jgi:hypothetical protein